MNLFTTTPDPNNSLRNVPVLSWLKRLCPAFVVALVLVLQSGCPKPTASVPKADKDAEVSVAPATLKVLFVDNPEIFTSISRHWSAESAGTLEFSSTTSSQLYESNFAVASDVDVIIFPDRMLGEFESRKILAPLPRRIWQSEEYRKDELLRNYRTFIPKHNNEFWGVPLGGPNFMMVYNQQAKEEMPADGLDGWQQLLNFVEARRSSSERAFFKLPLAKGWAAHVFLARSASLIRSRGRLSTVFERGTMKPLINSKPFELALDEIKQLMGEDSSQLELNPAALYRQIARGETAIGLTWPTPYPVAVEQEEQAVDLNFSSLPGSDDWYEHKSDRWIQRGPEEAKQYDLIAFGGMIGSVASTSRNSEDAFEFLAWLGNKSTPLKTLIYSPNSGPFRASHLGNAAVWSDLLSDESARRYADVLDAINQRDIIFMFPRVPGQQEYLNLLDDNVRKFLVGESTAKECLENTAKEWEAVTDRLGREKMIAELAKESAL